MKILIPVIGNDFGIIIIIVTILSILLLSYLMIRIIRKKWIKSIKFRIVNNNDE